MKAKLLLFVLIGLFLTACGSDETAKNQNANANSNKSNTPPPIDSNVPLILTGTSDSSKIPCGGRVVEIEETATANDYTLTGECKKITVDGVSNTVTAEKVGEIVVKGSSNKVVYVEGLDGKKPKISNTGTSTTVDSQKSLEEKKAKEEAKKK
jgi:Protein of unknown function (DUF3060)